MSPIANMTFEDSIHLNKEDLNEYERVARIQSILNGFRNSQFFKDMKKCTPVRPPITHTNVLKNDQNFKTYTSLFKLHDHITLETQRFSSSKKIELATRAFKEEEGSIRNLIGDAKSAVSDAKERAKNLSEQLISILDTLTPREEKVIRLRYGIDDGKPRTLEEVGREFNVTRERIRQIEAKALRKLRHPSRSKKLKDFLE